MFNIGTQINPTTAQINLILQDWLQRPVSCTAIVPLKGGLINSVLRLTFDQPPNKAVIKINTPDDGPYALDKEAAILRALRENTCFPCPEVYADDSSARKVPYAYLLLECLPGDNLHNVTAAGMTTESDLADIDSQLAQILLELHSHTRDTFGKIDEPGVDFWVDLFVPRLQEIRSQPEVVQRLSRSVLSNVDYAIERAVDTLTAQGEPTLVHADVWAGNIMVQPTSAGWHITGLVDPGSEYADVELELAYLESFNKPRPAFMQVYTQQHPLRAGYEVRRMIYWLQTYMIHVWLFGERKYQDLTASIAAELRQTL